MQLRRKSILPTLRGVAVVCVLMLIPARSATSQSASALHARDAFTASLPAALPPLSLESTNELSLRFAATKYYQQEPLRQTIALSGAHKISRESLLGITLARTSPDCAGCADWFMVGVDYERQVAFLRRVRVTASVATGFERDARTASSLGFSAPIAKAWSHGFVSGQVGLAFAGSTTANEHARALRPTVGGLTGIRLGRVSLDAGGQVVLISACPPIVGVRVGWSY